MGSHKALFSDRYFSLSMSTTCLTIFKKKCYCFADDVKLISQRSHSKSLQNDLMKAYLWSKDWNLPLNESKCAFLTSGTSPPTPCSLFYGGPELQQLHSVKDLGVLLDCSLKPSVHRIAAVKKARAALFLVKRSFVSLKPAVFLPLYCNLVRPHLEYAIQATSPYLKKDIYHTERFQRLATRMVKGLHHFLFI